MTTRYPGYRGLKPDALPPTRDEFRRWQEKYMVGADQFEELAAAFDAEIVSLAVEMGAFNEKTMSWTHPQIEHFASGDGVVLRPRFDALPGDTQLNTVTGAIEQKPYDPDADWFEVGGSEPGRKKKVVYGTKYGILGMSNGHDGEGLFFAPFDVTKEPGQDEMASMMRHLIALKEVVPGLQGSVHDKVAHGVHIDEGYKHGLMILAKVAVVKGGRTKHRLIDREVPVRHGRTVVGEVDVYARDGWAGLEFVAAGQRHFVPLVRKQTRPPRRHGRIYNEYEIPHDALVPPYLRKGQVRVRLNTNQADNNRRLNRAENIRAIPEGDPDWARIYKLRPMSEGRNSHEKHRQSWDRAPAVGRPRQRSAMLFGHLFKNFKAYLTYCRRVGLPLPSERGQAAA